MSLYSDVVGRLKMILALGGRVGLDSVAENETFPYVTIHPEIDSQIALQGDAIVMAYRPIFQVDLWEEAAHESYALRDAVLGALDGYQVAKPALRLRVESWQRLADPDPGVIHRAFRVGVVELV